MIYESRDVYSVCFSQMQPLASQIGLHVVSQTCKEHTTQPKYKVLIPSIPKWAASWEMQFPLYFQAGLRSSDPLQLHYTTLVDPYSQYVTIKGKPVGAMLKKIGLSTLTMSQKHTG